MLHYAGVFLVIALLAALFGFTGIAAGAVEIARVLFFVFIVLFIAAPPLVRTILRLPAPGERPRRTRRSSPPATEAGAAA